MEFGVRPLGQGDARGQTGIFGVRGDGCRTLPVAQHLYLGPRPVRHRRDEHGHAPGANRRVHAGLLRDALQSEFVHSIDVHFADLGTGGLLPGRRRHEHVVGGDVQHRPYVQLRPGERPFADGEHARATLVGDAHELSGGAPARHAREKIKPMWIFLRVHHPGRPRVRVHRKEELPALVPRLHENQRRTRR